MSSTDSVTLLWMSQMCRDAVWPSCNSTVIPQCKGFECSSPCYIASACFLWKVIKDGDRDPSSLKEAHISLFLDYSSRHWECFCAFSSLQLEWPVPRTGLLSHCSTQNMVVALHFLYSDLQGPSHTLPFPLPILI